MDYIVLMAVLVMNMKIQNLGENEWGTANFNVSRNEVRSFLVSNLYFWIKEFHIDGVRMDAISNMIYHKDGVSENRASIEFFTIFKSKFT